MSAVAAIFFFHYYTPARFDDMLQKLFGFDAAYTIISRS